MFSPYNFNLPGDRMDLECDTSKITVTDEQDGHSPNSPQALRVLVAGRSAAGKSTLVSSVFGWTARQGGVSHGDERTPLDSVWKELRDSNNRRLVLHDSGGFEAGGTAAVDELLEFIAWRRKKTNPNEMLHCIWYCISCSEKRLTHEVEEKFFKTVDVGDIPVIIAFTQFDSLIEKHKRRLRKQNLNSTQLDEIAERYAVTDYDQNFRQKIENKFSLKSTVSFVRVGIPDAEDVDDDTPLNTLPAIGIQDLLAVTRNRLENGALKSLLAYAQRYSVEEKLRESPDYGMDMFGRVQWTGAIPIIPFVGATGIYTAFCKILVSISDFWGIIGTKELIKHSHIRNIFFSAIWGVDSWYGRLGIHFLHSINITGMITADLTAEIVLKMVAAITLVHERLFWINLDNKGLPVNEADVRSAVQTFRKDGGRQRMLNTISGNVVFKGWSKKTCVALLKDAITIGKSPKYAELLAKQTMSY